MHCIYVYDKALIQVLTAANDTAELRGEYIILEKSIDPGKSKVGVSRRYKRTKIFKDTPNCRLHGAITEDRYPKGEWLNQYNMLIYFGSFVD